MLITSEDQDEELLSSTICSGKAVVGGERGVLRVWDVGAWNDEERVLDVAPRGGCTVDVLAAAPTEDAGGGRGMCAAGCDDGFVRFVDVGGKGKGMLRGEVRHDEMEGMVGLGWLRDGRLVSGGGAVVKIWEEAAGARVSYSSDEEEEGEDGVGDEGEGVKRRNGGLGSDDEDEEDGEGVEVDDSDEGEEEKPKKRGKKKKKKRGKGKKGQVGNGIMAFKGLT